MKNRMIGCRLVVIASVLDSRGWLEAVAATAQHHRSIGPHMPSPGKIKIRSTVLNVYHLCTIIKLKKSLIWSITGQGLAEYVVTFECSGLWWPVHKREKGKQKERPLGRNMLAFLIPWKWLQPEATGLQQWGRGKSNGRCCLVFTSETKLLAVRAQILYFSGSFYTHAGCISKLCTRKICTAAHVPLRSGGWVVFTVLRTCSNWN